MVNKNMVKLKTIGKIMVAILAILVISQIAIANDGVVKKTDINEQPKYFGVQNTDNVQSVQSSILVDRHAFLWKDGKMKDLGTLGGTTSDAHSINNKGNIAGDSTTSSGEEHVFFWKDGHMKDLGTLWSGHYCDVISINEKDQIAGNCESSTLHIYGFVWDKKHGMKNIGHLGGDYSYVAAMNNRGQIVGYSDVTNLETQAFIWDREHGMKKIGAQGQWKSSSANDINEKGKVVGSGFAPGISSEIAFVWDKENGVKNLETPAGYSSIAKYINDKGQIAGEIYKEGTTEVRGVTWENGQMKDLGTLGCCTSVTGINNRGQITGESDLASGVRHAFFWDEEHGMKDLGAFNGDWVSSEGINSNGQIIGIGADLSVNPEPPERGFITKSNGGHMTNLGSLGGGDVWPHAINDKGQVVGHSH